MRFGRLTMSIALGALLLAGPAQAAPIIVGSPLPPTELGVIFKVSGTFFNTTLAEPGTHLTSPVDGAIIGFRVAGGQGGPYRLRILRPAGANAYTAVGATEPVTLGSVPPQTFSPIRIQAGDTIGLDAVAGTTISIGSDPGSSVASWIPPLAEGSTAAYGVTKSGREYEFNAEVQPAPTISSLQPKSGSFKGGTKVTISGTDFAHVSSVDFGSAHAIRTRIDSEGKIIATAPAVKNLGVRHVSIRTVAGRSATSPVTSFEFTACVVPQLRGQGLSAVKRRLRKADCRLGSVTRRRGVAAKSGTIVRQDPAAGRRLLPGAKVNVTFG